MDVVETLCAGLWEVYREGPWLVATDVLQGWSHVGAPLRQGGIEVAMVLAARMGVGDPPAGVPWRCLGLGPARDVVEAIHGAEHALRRLPPDVQQAVDEAMPEGGRVLADFFGSGRPVAGRPVFGARPAAWQALEDKVVIDALWDAAGVERAPSRVVPVSALALAEAAADLDEGEGTVWAGDAREGFHGGAARTFWVREPVDAEAALACLAAHCDAARVMPFLEGVPCSVHGIVLPDGMVVLRPAEMLVLRRERRFVYCRAATFWDPPAEGREGMRGVARRVGEHLRREVGYRGVFTVDGVMTARGFRPTELNPRVGAALGRMVPRVPFTLLHYALVEGWRPPVDAEALEAALLAEADGLRQGSFGFTVDEALAPARRSLRWREGWEEVAEGGEDALVHLGPGPTGGFVNVTLTPGAAPAGPSFAPRVAAFARWADSALGTRLGPLSAAAEVT